MPSILTTPDCGSNTRCSSASAVDLPAPVGADQRDGLARQRGEVQIGDRRPLAVIGERHVVELDQPAQPARIDRVRPVAHRRLGVEHLEEFLQPRRVHHHAGWRNATACSSLPISSVAKLMNITISPTVVSPLM